MTRCETAEKILEYACEKENFINRADKKFIRTVFECGPSGYVGCSNECRGVGLLRRSGYMADIADYLLNLGAEKDRAIIEIKPVLCAFEKMKNTRSGHIIYYRIGKKMGVQAYADKIGISRRHCRRLYVKAMEEFLQHVIANGGASLVEKFEKQSNSTENTQNYITCEEKNAQNENCTANKKQRKIYSHPIKNEQNIFSDNIGKNANCSELCKFSHKFVSSYYHSGDYLNCDDCTAYSAEQCPDCCAKSCDKNSLNIA